MDRISRLPEVVLHHILYFLSQHEAARTCVLSKAWRWTWSTRPNVEFDFNSFKGTQKDLRSLVNKTLQVYHDRKLCIEQFVLDIGTRTSESICESEWRSLLDKWIPIVMHMGGINKFHLCIYKFRHRYNLPPSVIEAQSLQDLFLSHCNLYQVKAPNHNLHLRKLSLFHACFKDESLQNIISKCPLIEDIRIEGCAVLVYTTIKVNKCHNLKNFSFRSYVRRTSVEINETPKLETLLIDCREGVQVSWVVDHHHVLHNLRSLTLNGIRLSGKLFDYLSCNLPSLEKLIIFHCYGYKEFQLRSKTIRHFEWHLEFATPIDRGMSLKATIDAPNMLYFLYKGNDIPSLCFTTISSDCKSNISIELWPLLSVVSMWFLKLKEMLEALRNSEISLHFHLLNPNHEQVENVLLVLNFEVPQSQIVVENVHLTQCGSISSPLLNTLFRIFRPMNIEHSCFAFGRMMNDRVAEFLWKSLMERDDIPNDELIFWQQDLEEVSMQTFDRSQQKWLPFQGKSWLECAVFQRIRFQLKWGEAFLKLI